MSELTDEDRAAIESLIGPERVKSKFATGYACEIYLAGKRAGIAEGLERAAKECEKEVVKFESEGHEKAALVCGICAAAIRALKERT